MKSSTTASFRSRLGKLPPEVRALANKNFRLWLADPHYPSVQFKKVGRYWSARVGLAHRALAILDGDTVRWFWIGQHAEYERLLSE